METEFIHWLLERLPESPVLRLGPGDDAAVLAMTEGDRCVVTADLLAEGVHFQLARDGPRRVGRKALAVNLSDLAAMAARPIAAVVSLLLPRQEGFDSAVELYEGILPLAEEFNTAIAGGDTNTHDGPLVISVTAIGELTERGPLCRSGATPGDHVLLTGSFGGSGLGRHLDFTPRVREALLLHEHYTLHAGIDVSDGLSLDLWRMIEASRCGVVIEADLIPVADAAVKLAEQLADGRSPLEHALGDGEDFELILAVPPDEAQRLIHEQPLSVPLTKIGKFVPEQGIWLEQKGERVELEPRGYEH